MAAHPSERARRWKELNDIVMQERALRGDLNQNLAEREALREREAAQPDLISEDPHPWQVLEYGARGAVEIGGPVGPDWNATIDQLKIVGEEIKRRLEAQQAAREAKREVELDKVFGDLGEGRPGKG